MASMSSLAHLDGVAQAELVARGELRAEELIDACAARIAELDPLIHATTTLDLERARGAARQVVPGPDAPLAGVPFLVKDVTPYPGMRWSIGSRAFARNVAPTGTPYTDRLDRAGLVTVGKTTTSEMGLLGSTETVLEGVTHNPWDLSRSAAGSSGGSAAAVAAGLVPLAHANDGGGSIRIPASVCGLFGLKPSRGRTVRAVLADSDFSAITSDHCVSRSVRDSALFLALTEDRDGPLPAVGHVRGPSTRRLRIGAWTTTTLGATPHADVLRAHEEAVALLGDLGHQVEIVAPPGYDGPALGDDFFTLAGAAIEGAIAMLTQMGAPPDRRSFEPFTWSVVEAFRARGPGALEAARTRLASAARTYLDHVAGYDLVLTPTLATPPWRLGHLSPLVDPAELHRRTREAVGYTPIHNAAGCPAMSVPLHQSAAGLPIGAHFAAPPGGEAVLLGLAYELEEARPWRDRWAPFSIPAIVP